MQKTLAENGLKEQDTLYLSVPLAGGMQGDRGISGAAGAHISSVISFRGEEQKEDELRVQIQFRDLW